MMSLMMLITMKKLHACCFCSRNLRAREGVHSPPPSQLASRKEASDARLEASPAIQLASGKEASGASDARLALFHRHPAGFEKRSERSERRMT